MNPTRHVYLWSIDNPVIIVPAPTGIVYCNQTDGVACVHRELEGYLLPLPRLESGAFDPTWWERHMNRRIRGDEDEWRGVCREIELAFARVVVQGEVPRDLVVVEHEENAEAWVHVAFSFPELGSEGTGETLSALAGVLTWQNCD